VSDTKQAEALRFVLEELLKEYAPNDIRVLSPFATQSLAYRIMHTESKSADERWLKKHLRLVGQPGEIRWRSIAKFKGLEAEAVVITDINDSAVEFAESTGRSLNELIYVGMTRARYQAVVIGSRAPKL
jgi:superfamily I DNA/RNA helicase